MSCYVPTCQCSSAVEHLIRNEKVASSILATGSWNLFLPIFLIFNGGWKNWPTVFDVAALHSKATALSAQQQAPGFWDNQEQAQGVAKELSDIQDDISFIETTKQALEDASELHTLAEKESDQQTLDDISKTIADIAVRITQKEQELQFDGPYDKGDAIINIQAGAGGTDAQDWAQMLERMYLRFAENRGWPTSMYTRSPGDTAGIKSVTFEVKGKFAYGILRQEHGVHRLVRQSPFNSDNLRQTSFARVEVLPRIPEKDAPEIDADDLQIDTFRASGAGGQHVNKTSSAVRIKHIPTGIVVQCQDQRSQGQNKARAMAYLQARLQLLAQEQHVAHIKELRGEHKQAAWGNQIRSYVLHPYTLVKDHRTGVEETNVEKVLDGDIEQFLGVVY